MWATEAFDLFTKLPLKGKILDIGSHENSHAELFRQKGFKVITLDPHYKADIQSYWPTSREIEVDNIWTSHTLEHSRNPGLFLDAIHSTLKEGGWLSITVPPRKDEIVGGHVTLWNAGLLLYQLILSGFNCKKAKVNTYGYNVSVIVKKESIKLPDVKYNAGDIEKLSKFFPFHAEQGFNGEALKFNWFI